MAVFERVTGFGFSPGGRGMCRYFLVGDTGKPVIVLVGGYRGGHVDFGKLIGYLKGRYCVVVPELSGSEGAGFFKSFLDFLGLKSVVFVSHCVGSAVTVEFSLLYPGLVRELFLISVPHRNFTLPGTSELGIMNYGYKRCKEVEDIIRAQGKSFLRFDFRRASRLRVPVHFIHGGGDMVVRPHRVSRLARSVSRGTFDLVSRAKHVPALENPAAVAAVILGYLRLS